MSRNIAISSAVFAVCVGLAIFLSRRDSVVPVPVTLTGPDYYQAWIKRCVEVEMEYQATRGVGGINWYIQVDEWDELLAGYRREPDALLRLASEFVEGKSPNPLFDAQLHYALMKMFEVDHQLPFTWGDTSTDPDGVDVPGSSPRDRRYMKRLLEDIERKGRTPNQALQTTSVTRSGFGKTTDSDRQRRGV